MAAASFVQAIPFFPTPAPSRYQAPHSHYTLDALRKFAQGAGSALLVFSGADTVTSTPIAEAGMPAFDISSIDGILASIMNGPFSGHFQILAAAFLFLAAGRCVARFFGLAIAAGVMFLSTQGVTVEDALSFADHFGQRLVAAAQAFQMAEVS
ncbi:MAG: hypothetical protein R3C58_00515 [Parvularculaceae bacterium]